MPPPIKSSFAGTLHEAEARQLGEYLKKRSKIVDNDIKEMRKKLGGKIGDISLTSGKVAASIDSLQIKGKSLLTHSQGMEEVQDVHVFSKQDAVASHKKPERTQRAPQPKGPTMKEKLGTFLARIKIKMDDNGLTPVELRNLLLPLDLCLPTDTHVSMTELIYVLETDLVLPVAREDQLMILQEYGDATGDVNVRALLTEAGVWPEIAVDKKRDTDIPKRAGAAMARIRAGGVDDPILQYQNVDEAAQRPTTHSASLTRDPLARSTAHDDSKTLETGSSNDHIPDRRQESRGASRGASEGIPPTRASLASRDVKPQSAPASRSGPLGSALAAEFQASGNFKSVDFTSYGSHAREAYGSLIDRSSTNYDALSEFHRVVAADLDAGFDSMMASTENLHAKTNAPEVFDDRKFRGEVDDAALDSFPAATAPSRPQPTDQEDDVLQSTMSYKTTTKQQAPSSSSSGSKREMDPELFLDGSNKETAEEISEPRALSLAEENARLRGELLAFDGEFWEQLEDLKFRYSKLQEVVGEEPDLTRLPSTPGIAAFPMRPHSQTTSAGVHKSAANMPLDALPWSARNAMTAMDRAGITSSLARGRYGAQPIERPESRSTDRPYAHAYSYDPSTRAGTGSILPMETSGGAKSRGTVKAWDGTNRTRDELPPAPPLLRHSTGSFPSGPLYGEGTGSDAAGSLASMCERRLLFELGNHPAPEQSARQLIHRIQDVAHRKGDQGRFITCSMLSDALTSVGVKMGLDEVTMLATGFGSNGKGGIDSKELSEALQALLYNFMGEHEVVENGRRRAQAGQREVQREEDAVYNAMVEVCMSILTHDKKAIIGAGASLYDTLVDPFAAMDTSRLGVLPFSQFSRVLRDIGAMLDYQEGLAIATRFEVKGSKAAAALGREFPDHDGASEFKEERLRGSLKGAANDDFFGSWLASNTQAPSTSSESSQLAVDYTAFVAKLADLMDTIIAREGGLVPGSGLGGIGASSDRGGASDRLWMLKEFDLIEALICQLELMRPSERRRCLLSLQYAVTAADSKQEGEIDGFSLLSALLGAGFRLQRLNRVRLLRAIEELGGKIDHIELCQVLIRSCADWTSEERGVVQKILKAMGITVLERRAWLGRVRVALMKAAADFGGKAAAIFSADAGSAGSTTNDPGIPPSAFLHIMRDNGVSLGVEEEATLLDCLDTERLADVGRSKATEAKRNAESGAEDSVSRAIASIGKNSKRASAGEATSSAAFGGFGMPLTHYKSFLAFCARHTGDWMDAAPDNTEKIHEALRGVPSPTIALQEFTSMLQAFDETSSGYVGNRTFQIACHRSRLFADLAEDAVKNTADILTAEGGGKIRYTPFLIYLRALCSQLSAATDCPGICEQLLKNASDPQGTLLPLRKWLLSNTDTDSCLLTPRDLNSMLREFSVVYRPDDLEIMLIEIGQRVGTEADTATTARGNSSSQQQSVLDARDLFRHLFKLRGPWTLIHTDLCRNMIRSLSIAGAQVAASRDSDGANIGAVALSLAKGPRGIESAAARRLLARLRAFADIVSGERLVDLDIFGHVAKATGLSLSEKELLVLADATDPHPCARQVRCDVVVEALTVEMPSLSTKSGSSGLGGKSTLSEAAEFALKHLQEQIWTTGLRLKRNPTEWIADVKAAFRGFDSGAAGFVTTEDFFMALALLNASISPEILRDIPIVPEGPGLIAYLEILEKVLMPPPAALASARAAERSSSSSREKVSLQVDRSKMPRPGSKSSAVVERGASAGASKENKKPAAKEKDSPISSLIAVIRKALRSFIVQDDSLESAWMCLLKAFRRFDPNENGTVSPRDFCLAVSVLLGGDEVLLSEAAWLQVIEHYAYKDDQLASRAAARPGSDGDSRDKSSGVQVDYMEFCGNILDAKDLKAGATAKLIVSGTSAGSERTRPIGSTASKGSTTQGAASRSRAMAAKK